MTRYPMTQLGIGNWELGNYVKKSHNITNIFKPKFASFNGDSISEYEN